MPPRSACRRFPIFRSYLCFRNARTGCVGMADDTAQGGTLETQENSVTCYGRPLPAITYFRASAFLWGLCVSEHLLEHPGRGYLHRIGEISPVTRASEVRASVASAAWPRWNTSSDWVSGACPPCRPGARCRDQGSEEKDWRGRPAIGDRRVSGIHDRDSRFHLTGPQAPEARFHLTGPAGQHHGL